MGGWGVSYPKFFWIFILFLYLQGPLVSWSRHYHNQWCMALPGSVVTCRFLFFGTGAFSGSVTGKKQEKMAHCPMYISSLKMLSSTNVVIADGVD